jgi:hypothetical protein
MHVGAVPQKGAMNEPNTWLEGLSFEREEDSTPITTGCKTEWIQIVEGLQIWGKAEHFYSSCFPKNGQS